MICRGVEETLPNAIRSLKKAGVDFLNITLNQQQEEKQIIDTCQEVDLPYQVTKFEWCNDTGKSRQFNLEHVPEGYDWLGWSDSDDTIEGNLIPIIEDAGEDEIIWLWYHYSEDVFGKVTNKFIRERLVKTSIVPPIHWEGIIHETLVGCENFKNKVSEGAYMKHHHKDENRADRNIVQLEKCLKETGNPRMMMYLGHHYSACGQPKKAVEWYEKFVDAPNIGMAEKWQGLCYAAGCCRNVGDFARALDFAFRAIRVAPEWRDAYIEISIDYYYLKEPDLAIYWAEQAKVKKQASNLLFYNPLLFNKDLPLHLALAHSQKGNFEIANQIMHGVMEDSPDDGLITEVGQRVKECLIRNKTVDGLKALCVSLYQHGEIEKLTKVKDIIPWWVEDMGEEYQSLVQGIEKKTILTSASRNKAFYMTNKEGEGKWKDADSPRYQWLIGKVKELGAKTVIDIGCGSGVLDTQLVDAGVEVFGVEANSENCDALKEKGIPYWNGFFEEFETDKHYDVAIMTEYLEHVIDPLGSFNKAAELADTVLVTVPRPVRGDTREISTNIQDHLRVVSISDIERYIADKSGRRPETIDIIDANTGDLQNLLVEVSHRLWSKKERFFKFFEAASGEEWNPHHLVPGGSETALVEVAKELDKKENLVFVYYNGERCVYNGVVYRPFGYYNSISPCSVFIASRSPGVFNQDIATKVKYLWAHDVHYGDTYNQDIEDKIDGVFLESEFHKNKWVEQYPFSKKTHVVGAGIDTNLFKGSKRIKNKFIWASAPNRGLLTVLEMWGDIRKAIPDATLDIYYGWNWFDKWGGEVKLPGLKGRITQLCGQEGVEWKGRVPHKELIKALERTDIWLYLPDTFEEVYCALAVECQAAGVLCFYQDSGALPETVGNRGVIVTKDNAVNIITSTLANKNLTKHLRSSGKKWAKKQTWSGVVERMCDIIAKDEQERDSKDSLKASQ